MFITSLMTVLISWTNLVHSTSQDVTAESDFGEIVLANVIFRHGDRTPVAPYHNDPYKNVSSWPVGWGQLTNIGKEQHFKLGQWLRNRYSDFLPNIYSNEDIYVRSTDVDRTLMSAESNLAGLYPPVGAQQWHKNLSWQPIPIHTTPEVMDEVLAAKKPCPKYQLGFEKLMNSPHMQIFNKKNADLYAYLTKHSGSIVKDVVTLEYLYDTLHIEDMYNMTLPQWTKDVYPQKLLPIAAYSFTLEAFTKNLQRLKSGPLLDEIISHMKSKANGSLNPPRRMFVYSGHDTTIANLLMTLKVFDVQSPPYASLILIELRRNKLQDYQVTIFYRNSTKHDPYLLTIPGCSSICPLDKFINLTKSVIPENWDDECRIQRIQETQFGFNNITVIAFFSSGFLGVMLILSVLFSIIYWKRQKMTSYYYHRVHSEGT